MSIAEHSLWAHCFYRKKKNFSLKIRVQFEDKKWAKLNRFLFNRSGVLSVVEKKNCLRMNLLLHICRKLGSEINCLPLSKQIYFSRCIFLQSISFFMSNFFFKKIKFIMFFQMLALLSSTFLLSSIERDRTLLFKLWYTIGEI